MLFRLPHPPLAFEIPDDWWMEAGAAHFKPTGQSYRSVADAVVTAEFMLALDKIAPMLRLINVTRDHHGFRRQGGHDGGPGGMVDVLQAIIGGIYLPPVTVRPLRGESAEGFGYAVLNGCHRFYASHALGFTHLPSILDTDLGNPSLFGDD